MNEQDPSRLQRTLRWVKANKFESTLAALILGFVVVFLASPLFHLGKVTGSPSNARSEKRRSSESIPVERGSSVGDSADGAVSRSSSTQSTSSAAAANSDDEDILRGARGTSSETGPLLGSTEPSVPTIPPSTSADWRLSGSSEAVKRPKRKAKAEAPPEPVAPVYGSASVIVVSPVPPPPRAEKMGGPSTVEAAPPPPEPLFPLDNYLAQLAPGNMAFRRPPSMVRGETKTVTLLVSQTLSIPELKGEIQAKGDVVEGHAIKIAPLMRAHLTGGAFEINLITEESQPISQTQTTEWKWEIKPKEFGKLRLHLAVSALVKLGDTERTRTLRTFEETVEVNVSWTESAVAFLGEHVEWIVEGIGALVLIPLFHWSMKRWRRYAKQRHGTAVAHGSTQTGASANPFARLRGRFRRLR